MKEDRCFRNMVEYHEERVRAARRYRRQQMLLAVYWALILLVLLFVVLTFAALFDLGVLKFTGD